MLSRWLKEKPRCVLNWIKNNLRKVSIFALILLIIALGAGIWLNPPTIHFDGVAEEATFSFVSDRQTAYNIKCDNSNNSEIKFGADKTEIIYVVNASVSKELIQDIQEGKFTDWESSNEVFPFIEGSATLFSGAPMCLMLELPEGGYFTYDMEVAQDENKKEGKRNRIELKDFSADLAIQLDSTYDISMKGNTKPIPRGLYRIIGCTTITFYAVPSGSEGSEISVGPPLEGTVKHFRFMNAETDTLETSYLAETNSSAVGHVPVEGTAEKGEKVIVEISDIGQYPIPIVISGQVKSLEIAGADAKPNLKQWLFEARSALLQSIIVGCIGFLLGTAFGKKPSSKAED